MNKNDIMILAFLLGLVGGLSTGLVNMFFLKYTIKAEYITEVLNDSCHRSKLQNVSVENFGKSITVECADGKTMRFVPNSITVTKQPDSSSPQSGNTGN